MEQKCDVRNFSLAKTHFCGNKSCYYRNMLDNKSQYSLNKADIVYTAYSSNLGLYITLETCESIA